MKNNYIVKLLLLFPFLLLGLVSCKEKSGPVGEHKKEHTQEYTCPMHPQILRNAPGTCPICGMDLVPKTSNNELLVDSSISSLAKPVNSQVVATIPTVKAESGRRIFSVEVQGSVTYDTRSEVSLASRVDGRIEKMYIKYNYQPVSKGQLILEVYSPDLAVAQRELLLLAKTGDDHDMVSKARQRLQLLGMQPAQIAQVLKTGKILYRVPVFSNEAGYILEKQSAASTSKTAAAPSSSASGNDGMGAMGAGNNIPVASAGPVTQNSPLLLRVGQYVIAGQSLFTIYQNRGLIAEFSLKPEIASHISKGQKLLYQVTGTSDELQTGSVGLIQPIVRNGESFAVARVYLNNSNLRAGQLLTAKVPVVYSDGWWLPQKAVWQSGNKSIVFRKQGNAYVPMQVETGAMAEGMIRVITSIRDWEVAENASYLVDSESFIKTTTTK